jgi:hypothetical protein
MDIPFLSPKEFRDFGYLQEANRLFFHPLGLALAVDVDDNGEVTGIAGVYVDNDPEGTAYDEGLIDPLKAARVRQVMAGIAEVRKAKFGFVIQPVPETES